MYTQGNVDIMFTGGRGVGGQRNICSAIVTNLTHNNTVELPTSFLTPQSHESSPEVSWITCLQIKFFKGTVAHALKCRRSCDWKSIQN